MITITELLAAPSGRAIALFVGLGAAPAFVFGGLSMLNRLMPDPETWAPVASLPGYEISPSGLLRTVDRGDGRPGRSIAAQHGWSVVRIEGHKVDVKIERGADGVRVTPYSRRAYISA